MTPTKNGCSSEPGPAKAALSFTSAEIRYLKQSWETASSTMDIGCELVARLLNDNRTRFRALIETHSGDVLGSANFTAEDVKKYRRARAVGAGVVTFFNQVISKVDSPDAADFIAIHSQRLELPTGDHHGSVSNETERIKVLSATCSIDGYEKRP
ncbi:hypothetical protein GCK32_017163 [Trichostrongylus colubriformis]|uniref:Uncharacterized protein n=1 Tax=Trichostrongylus colubriformis TaxID=6319 RepID=A0AAN8IIZ5_TRICO